MGEIGIQHHNGPILFCAWGGMDSQTCKSHSLEAKMRKVTAALSALAFGLILTAQEPVVDIDKKIHPNLAEAQRLVVEANHYVELAQRDNRYDMKGHAERARDLLVQVNNELKAAAEAANAGMRK
jgi:hypothetical protein